MSGFALFVSGFFLKFTELVFFYMTEIVLQVTEFVLYMTEFALTMTTGRSRPAPSWPARHWPPGGGRAGTGSTRPPGPPGVLQGMMCSKCVSDFPVT